MKNALSCIAVLLICMASCIIVPNLIVCQTLEKAISDAIFCYNKDAYGSQEAQCEGHLILSVEEQKNLFTIYALVSYGEYGFENGHFTKQGGSGAIPVKMTFMKQADIYTLTSYHEADDGERYWGSIRSMFPFYLWPSVLNCDNRSDALAQQEMVQARTYLAQIGRTAEVGKAANQQVDVISISDFAANDKICNAIFCDERLSEYPHNVGEIELVGGGIRYIYSFEGDTETRIVTYTKRRYADNTIVEQYCFDGNTGTELGITLDDVA